MMVGICFKKIGEGGLERTRSANGNTEETKLTVNLQLLKLGDGYLGVH